MTIRLREPSGRVLGDRIALKVNAGKSFIGVKPLFDGSVPEGRPAEFEIVGIGPDGKQIGDGGPEVGPAARRKPVPMVQPRQSLVLRACHL